MKHLYTILLAMMISLGAAAAGPSGDLPGGTPFLEVYTVAPNPVTNGFLNISYKTLEADQVITLRVYNLIGQEMHKEDLAPFSGEQKVRLDMSSFPKGIYMIELSNGQNTRMKRVSVI